MKKKEKLSMSNHGKNCKKKKSSGKNKLRICSDCSIYNHILNVVKRKKKPEARACQQKRGCKRRNTVNLSLSGCDCGKSKVAVT